MLPESFLNPEEEPSWWDRYELFKDNLRPGMIAGEAAVDNNPPSTSGNFFENLAGLVGNAFKSLFFNENELPNGQNVLEAKEEVLAVSQGPVAIVISGNLAAQMYTGGIDVSGGVVIILKGDDKGTYAIVDGGVPFASSGYSASAAVQVMPVFYQGNPDDFKIGNLEGTRLEVNTGIPLTPIVAVGFKSTNQNYETTFGIYLGYGKAISVKGISLKQPFQTNLGMTNVITR